MATLGEKVTDTIVGAIGRGAEGFALKDKDSLKAIIGPQVADALAKLPEDSPFRNQIEAMTSNTGAWEIFTMAVGAVVGIMQTLQALGRPWEQLAMHAAYHANPNFIASPETMLSAGLKADGLDNYINDNLQALGFDEGQRRLWRLSFEQPLREDDVREAFLRGDMHPNVVNYWLKAAGYNEGARNTIQKLYWRLPGVQDIIRMAVKEAFTPEIATKFGQYADLPPKFVELAAKQGLNAEVAGWYWAAHWELPSTTQGYEMLHRGVIKEEELDLLLRAQDVMPWWRDKLKAVAYSPLTRVDVRRMFHLGVLTEAQVVQAYKDLGYNQANAEKLLEFTRQYYGPEDEDPEEEDRAWTKAEILEGYRKKIITTGQTTNALREMGYADTKIDFYLAREDLKAEQTRKEAYTDRWHSLYINGVASADDVTANLTALGLAIDEINELLSLWHLERLQAVQRPTKAERTRWLKAGIITEAAWTAEMQLDGYSDRYISWYLAEIKEQPGLAIQEEEAS